MLAAVLGWKIRPFSGANWRTKEGGELSFEWAHTNRATTNDDHHDHDEGEKERLAKRERILAQFRSKLSHCRYSLTIHFRSDEAG